eukprot:scpid54641/ scgid34023/ 
MSWLVLCTMPAFLQPPAQHQQWFDIVWNFSFLCIISNCLQCHMSPGLMVRLQSNPWTTQVSQLFGIKAQNYQALCLVLYHQSWVAKCTHFPTIFLDFFAWTYVTAFFLGTNAALLLVAVVFIQAVSTTSPRIIILAGFLVSAALRLVWSCSVLPLEAQLQLCRLAQSTILIGAVARTLGHLGETMRPPMPAHRQESVLWRFADLRQLELVSVKNVWAGVMGLVAETSAGIPFRLLVPLLNVLLGKLHCHTSRPKELESLAELEARSTRILRDGWTRADPHKAKMITQALALESVPNDDSVPALLLWRRLLTLECLGTVLVVQGMWSCTDDLITSAVVPVACFALCLWRLPWGKTKENCCLDTRVFCYLLEALVLCGVFAAVHFLSKALHAKPPGSDSYPRLSQSEFLLSMYFLAVSGLNVYFLVCVWPSFHKSRTHSDWHEQQDAIIDSIILTQSAEASKPCSGSVVTATRTGQSSRS